MAPESRHIALIVLTVLALALYLASNKLWRSKKSQFPQPIVRLQSYLRIRTDHPDPKYGDAIAFLNETVADLLPSASVTVHNFVTNKPVMIIRILGSDPNLPSIFLNSHLDVVPAEAEKWSVDPFAATVVHQQNDLRLYARGSQDMKSVGMQYLEALSNLLKTDWKPLRTINVVFVPDEEIGGVDGMGQLVASPVFTDLNVGVAIDEGLSHPNATLNIFYGERQTWWLHVTVTGSPGHGATLPENTASATLHSIVDRALAFRLEQFAELNAGKDIGEVVNVNLVFLDVGTKKDGIPGGFVMNMIPSVASAGFDIRVPPTISKESMEAEIERWLTCEDGLRCPGVSTRWIHKVDVPVVTSRDPVKNPFIIPFAKALEDAGVADRLRHAIFFGATDSRYLRELGIPCFGFSPMEQTPVLLHKHDEYILVDGYLRGISVYEKIISHLADFNDSIEYIMQWTPSPQFETGVKDIGAGENEGDDVLSDNDDGVKQEYVPEFGEGDDELIQEESVEIIEERSNAAKSPIGNEGAHLDSEPNLKEKPIEYEEKEEL